jgi:hypothetical protein
MGAGVMIWAVVMVRRKVMKMSARGNIFDVIQEIPDGEIKKKGG